MWFQRIIIGFMEVGNKPHHWIHCPHEARGWDFVSPYHLVIVCRLSLHEALRGDSLLWEWEGQLGAIPERKRNSYVQLSQPVVCWSPYSSLKLCALLPNSVQSHHPASLESAMMRAFASWKPTEATNPKALTPQNQLLNICGHTPKPTLTTRKRWYPGWGRASRLHSGYRRPAHKWFPLLVCQLARNSFRVCFSSLFKMCTVLGRRSWN